MKSIAIAVVTALLLGCQKNEETTEKASPEGDFSASDLPLLVESIAPISLRYGDEIDSNFALARSLPFKCGEERPQSLGIFGGLWYYACVLSDASRAALFGQVDPYVDVSAYKEDQAQPDSSEQGGEPDPTPKNDGTAGLTPDDLCSKVVAEDKASLFSILCRLEGDEVIDSVLENPGSDGPAKVAINFARVEGLESTGSFSPRGLNFPLGARVWDGGVEGSWSPAYAVQLKSATEGKIDIFYTFTAEPAEAQIEFRQAPEGADCATSLQRDDCHRQDFRMYGADSADLQRGMAFTILANDKKDPSLVVIEGSWTLTPTQARKLMTATPGTEEDTLFEAGRRLYFRMIKKDRLIWGQFIIRGEDGEIIPGAGDAAGHSMVLAEPAGHCMHFDESKTDDSLSGIAAALFNYYPCDGVDFADLSSKLTLGEEGAEFVDASLPISELDFTR